MLPIVGSPVHALRRPEPPRRGGEGPKRRHRKTIFRSRLVGFEWIFSCPEFWQYTLFLRIFWQKWYLVVKIEFWVKKIESKFAKLTERRRIVCNWKFLQNLPIAIWKSFYGVYVWALRRPFGAAKGKKTGQQSAASALATNPQVSRVCYNWGGIIDLNCLN